jgi:hypothetical protein
MAMYKQKCIKCKSNYQLASRKDRYVICFECHKPDFDHPINDKEMKKLFDIPLQFYIDNTFLRDIKIKYIKFGELSEKQIEAFKKTVNKMSEEKNAIKKEIGIKK